MDMADVRLTNNTHETSFGEILKGRSYFRIPPFQRAYKWKQQRIDQLIADINLIKDEEEDAHFIGAFIIDSLPSDPNAPANYEVIDGQQRLTTFYLLIAGAVRSLLKQGEIELASELALEYLFTREGTTRLRTSLIPSIPDQGDLNAVVDDLWGGGLDKGLSAYSVEPLPIVEASNGRVAKNYDLLRRHAGGVLNTEGVEGLRRFVTAAQSGLTVVQILVKDPTSGPKIFDSLNSKQEPMTTGDLVRNEVFSKVARIDPLKAQEMDQHLWQPFYASFKRGDSDNFEGFFFPYGLIQDPSFRKGDVYTGLRKMWAKSTPQEVMSNLESYRLEYQDLMFGQNKCGLQPAAAEAVIRLSRLNFPKVALPFLMRTSHAIRMEEIDAKTGTEMLETAENFLVRRALCSIEPTGLHAVFKRLWTQLDGEYTAENIRMLISLATTVTIPSDDDVKQSFDKPFYGKAVSKFFLYEYDVSLGGDPGSYESLWKEHVLPKSHHETNWHQFSKKEHEKLAHLAGNLIPLSASMNNELGQASYSVKRKDYESDSMFKSARMFATKYSDWTPQTLIKRNVELADWAVKRWTF